MEYFALFGHSLGASYDGEIHEGESILSNPLKPDSSYNWRSILKARDALGDEF